MTIWSISLKACKSSSELGFLTYQEVLKGWVSLRCWLPTVGQFCPSVCPSIHPVSINTFHFFVKTDHQSYPALMVVGCWSPSQLCRGESEVTPWASCQCITGPHRETNNHSHSHIQTVQSFKEKRQLVLKPLSFVGETLLVNVQRIQKSESLFYAYMTS